MVALGCRHCSMFFMLSLFSPLCPSHGFRQTNKPMCF
jgi:hypothetical protein